MAKAKNRALEPDTMLVTLNKAIEKALRQYLSADGNDGIAVRFDLPDSEEKPDQPTVSVFLYDIQEDLQLRHGESRQYSPMKGTLLPGRAHVRCCYLITYWDTAEGGSADSPNASPDSQSVLVMNQVLNALLNNRELPDIPASYSRVIPPSEHLNSLGNFWQALGNKPRLSLSYSVTVPITLQPIGLGGPPIKNIESSAEDKSVSTTEILNLAGPALWNVLYTQLRAAAPSDEMIRPQLAKVNVVADEKEPDANAADDKISIAVKLSGLATTVLKAEIMKAAQKWQTDQQPVCVINGKEIFVTTVEADNLKEV